MSSKPYDMNSWDSVVLDGDLGARGMASFADQISEEESDAIREYVIQQAWRAKEIHASQR